MPRRGCRRVLPSAFGAKLFFTASLLSIMLLGGSLFVAPYIILYFYTATFFPLMIYRVITYWKLKQQLFLLDPCYFINFFSIVVMWSGPDVANLLRVQFGFANGPVLWAPLVFRNSLVLNDVDRMTSTYIHILPPLAAFVMRWMPQKASFGWYKPFARTVINGTEMVDQLNVNNYNSEMWLWALVIPICVNCVHSVLYVLIVHCLWRPSEEYVDSYSYLSKKEGPVSRIMRRHTGNQRLFVGWLGFFLVGSLQYLVVALWYCFLSANITALTLQFLLITWNGATYHVDVYRRALRTTLEAANVKALETVASANNKVTDSPTHDDPAAHHMRSPERARSPNRFCDSST